MIFASKAFFIFLPLVLLGYHLPVRRGHKYAALLVASWAFYAWVPPHYLWVILLLTLIDYVAGLRIERATDPRSRKLWLTASVVSNLGLLVGFKYTPFLYDNAVSLAQMLGVPASDRAWRYVLPLGISFHTFQGISYTVDVYRRHIRAMESFRDYALFVSFFPQLAAGPIVRAVDFLPQMAEPPRVTERQVADGVALFAFGLFKKLFVADQLDELFVSPVFAAPARYDDAVQRWAVLAWAVQIYCDFSGYTDMALGSAKWFGFELPPNFRRPYLATSITDFWRRWHLSLSTWLRDYFYFPMGGSKHGPTRTYFNLMVLFTLCGLWHGAAWNWLAYGVVNGALVCLHRIYDRAVTGIPWADAVRASVGWKVLAWAGTAYQFLLILVLVRMHTWAEGWLFMRSMAGMEWQPPAESTGPAFTPWAMGVPLAVPVLIAVGMLGHLWGLMVEAGVARETPLPTPLRMFAAAGAVVLVVTLGPGVAQSFFYIQF